MDRHHLVPRSKGGTEAELLHQACHRKIHSLLSDAELRDAYSTWEALRGHSEIAKYVKWARRQHARNPAFLTTHRAARSRSRRHG